MPPTSDSLNFTTKVDLSGLQSGMQQAAQTVQTGAQTIAQAMTAAQVATQNLASAQQQLGPAAAAGNQQAQTIIAQYQAALQQAQAAVQQFAQAQQVQTQTAVQNAAANQAAAAATTQVGISARQAASAGIGILEGRMLSGTRAAGALLTTTLGLGPVIEAAFPIIGAAALIEVLVDIGSELGNVAFKADEVGSTLGGSMWDGIAAMVQGVGWNIDELVKSEDQLIQKTAAVHAEIVRLTADQVRRTLGPKAGAEVLAGFDMDRDKQVQAQIRQTVQELRQLQEQAKETTEVTNGATGTITRQPTSGALSAQTQIPEKQAQLRYLQSLDEEYQRQSLDARQKGNDEQQRLDEEAARKRAAEARKAQEEEMRARKEYGDYVVSTTRRDVAGNNAPDRVNESLNQNEIASLREDSEEWRRSEQIKEEARRKDIQTGREWSRATEQLSLAQEKAAASVQEGLTQYQLTTGTISPLQAAYAEAKEHAQAFAQELDVLNKRLQEQQLIGDKVGATQTQGQIVQLQGRASVSGLQDQANINALKAQPFVEAANQVGDAWTSAFNKILVGGQQSWHALADAGEQMVLSLIDDAERWALKWLEKEALTLAFHQTTAAAKATADATAAATSAATTSAFNVAAATSYSGVAAAGAAASQAFIPFVGPEMAAAAVAAMLGVTAPLIGMAAFETGGIIPNTGVALVHQGEAVLPRNLTEMLMTTANSGSDQGTKASVRDINLHYHGGQNSGPRDMMREFQRVARRRNLI